jgi:hypothetical protein
MRIETQVERQINEQSSFSPIEWLIDEGRLMYSDYEQWRNGESPNLESLLLGDINKITQQLQIAQAHALTLGMKKESITFDSWKTRHHHTPQHTTTALTISLSPKLHQLLSCQFVRADEGPQLDLFFDNPVVFIENGLRQALASRDLTHAHRLMNKLSEQDPNHKHLNAFENLLAYAEHISDPLPADLTVITEEMAGLEEVIEPLTKRCLQGHMKDYLVPAWRRLACSLKDTPFNEHAPKLHASYAWKNALNWLEVKKQITLIPDHLTHYVLCERLALAEYCLQQREQSALLWCHLFWLDAKQAQARIITQADHSLIEAWHDFIDHNDEIDARWFPAWLLLVEPGLAHHHLSENSASENNVSKSRLSKKNNTENGRNQHLGLGLSVYQQAFAILSQLLSTPTSDKDEIALRKSLSEIAPTLLKRYQKSIKCISFNVNKTVALKK